MYRAISTLLVFASLSLAVLSQSKVHAQEDSIAFENVRVRTMQAGTGMTDGFVIVSGSIIQEVGEGELPEEFEGRRIDGAGAVLIPGLADMHVHYYENDIGAAYLANSITLVRNLTGSIGAARRDQAAFDGRTVAPRLKTSGPIIDSGPGFANDLFIRVYNPDQAIGAVRAQARSGYGAIKLYEQLDAATFKAAVEEARRNGMRVYAHVPASLTVGDLLALKIDSLEHLDGYAEAMARDGFSTDREYAWAEQWANVDREKFEDLARATVESGSWVVPTFAITYGRIASADPDAYFARPEARILPSWAESWRKSAESYAADRLFFEPSLTEKIAFLSTLREVGANVLIGTDGPNPFVTPGYAIHDELTAFARAGYSNEEILRIATVEAARFLDETGRTGTIEEDAPADLVLLPGDPVENLSYLREPLGVMVAGHWRERTRIDEALERRAARLEAERELQARKSSDD